RVPDGRLSWVGGVVGTHRQHQDLDLLGPARSEAEQEEREDPPNGNSERGFVLASPTNGRTRNRWSRCLPHAAAWAVALISACR
ncbi:MAG: hypothetical protein M0T79_07860, partial [Actinomycetota bacterium]|nr:hypothetical protein [Actinomycetota bacterium]